MRRPSRVQRVLDRLVEAVLARPNVTLAAGLLVAGVSIWAATSHLTIETGRSQMISPDQPFYQNYLRFKSDFANEEFLVLVLEVQDDPRRTEAALLDLAGRLERSIGQDIRAVYLRKGLDFFREHGLLYADEPTFRKAIASIRGLAEIASEPGLEAIFRTIEKKMAEGGGEAEFGADDLRFLEEILAGLAARLAGEEAGPTSGFDLGRGSGEGAGDPLADYFTSTDGEFVFLYVVPLERSTELEEAGRALDIVRGTILQTRSLFPDQVIGLTGRPAVDADEMATTQRDMTIATVLALGGITMLFFLQFHSPVRTAAALFSLVIAIAATFGVATVWPGRLTLLSIVFTAILVGLGIDFGVYLLTRFEIERRTSDSTRDAIRLAVSRTGRATLIGAVTTALAFSTTLLIDFRGIAELGFIAAAGILLCFLSMMTLLPAALVWIESRRPETPEPASATSLPWSPFRGARLPGAILAVALLATAVSIPAALRLGFQANPIELQPEGLESVEYERLMIEASPRSTWFGVSIVPAGELAELRRRVEAFRALDEVGEVESILDALPIDQDERIPVLARLARELPGPHPRNLPPVDPAAMREILESMLDQIPMLEDGALGQPDPARALEAIERLESAIRSVVDAAARAGDERARSAYAEFQVAFIQGLDETGARIRAMTEVRPVTLDRLPDFYEEVFLSEDGTSACLHVHPEEDPNDPVHRARYVAACREVDPEFTGSPVIFHHVSGLMKDGFREATVYSLLTICLVLVVSSRRWLDALLSFLPLVLGLIWLLGTMALIGMDFNLANFFGIPILIGIGVDVGVHFVHRFREGGSVEDAWRETGKAIVTAALTSAIGFGSMMTAHHRGIQSLGLLLTIGILTTLAASLLALPALLTLLARRGQ